MRNLWLMGVMLWIHIILKERETEIPPQCTSILVGSVIFFRICQFRCLQSLHSQPDCHLLEIGNHLGETGIKGENGEKQQTGGQVKVHHKSRLRKQPSMNHL